MLLRRTKPTTGPPSLPHQTSQFSKSLYSSSSSKATPFCTRKKISPRFHHSNCKLLFSTASEKTAMMSSEESSLYPDDSGLELGLALSIGGGGGTANSKQPPPPAAAPWGHHARILTGNDFPPVVSTKPSSSSSSSSSVTKVNSSGSKRTADSPGSPPARSAISQVVGWPPVKTYRMNSQTSQAKSPVMEELFSATDKCKSKNTDKTSHGDFTNNKISNEKGFIKTSLFVKVNMDGVPIGRKVDLNSHNCYMALARALEDMFLPSATVGKRRTSLEEQTSVAGKRQPMHLLDGSSDFILTYEDKEGDWMLVGDVPWEIFLNSVRRLRIMRATDSKGLGISRKE